MAELSEIVGYSYQLPPINNKSQVNKLFELVVLNNRVDYANTSTTLNTSNQSKARESNDTLIETSLLGN